MSEKLKDITEDIENKLEYLGLNLEKLPKHIKNSEPLNFKVSKFYDEKQYRQYRYIPIKDIQILLSPTSRQDEVEEKYKKASPLADYLDTKKEENIIKHTTFLNMLKNLNLKDIEKIEEEQENLNREIPFKVKFKGNYLWQIYYSENTDKYFMLVSTEETDYSTFFYLLKKQLEKRKTGNIFVPIKNIGYKNTFLKKSQYEDIENYLWLYTKSWPYIYEVYDKKENLTIQIVGETEVYNNIKSTYKIKIENKEKANQFYKLLKAMFILQTEVPHYFQFKTKINNIGEIEFFLDDEKIEYSTILKWITKKYNLCKDIKIKTKELIEANNQKLEDLKREIVTQEIEYLSKEKQITTFLECKKSFFGKFKYYFKYSKKSNKNKIKDIQVNQNDEFENEEVNLEEIKKTSRKNITEKNFKEHYTIEELVEIYKELEIEEDKLKNLLMDINALKLKKKNMEKKIENAALFIEEIDNHKKSIFEFWKYSNKDEIATLPEGEAEEINVTKKITKVFDHKEDLEKLGKMIDKIQRKSLTKEETDSIYITTTNVLDMLNKVKNNEITPRDMESSLRELKKELVDEKILTEKDEVDIFGGIIQDNRKISEINSIKHRELPKDKFNILEINKDTNQIGYKLTLEKILENIKKAINKVVLPEDILVYKAIENDALDPKVINIFEINPEKEINKIIKKENYNTDKARKINLSNSLKTKNNIKEKEKERINFYKFSLKRGINAISYTNAIFYDNQNKTLPIGQNLSSQILIDVSKLNLELKEKSTFKILEFKESNSDFSKYEIKTVNVYEYDIKET